MEIVTGKRGFPHVSSYEMQTFQRGLVSDGDVLLDVGDKLNYTIVDNNTVRILSGAILMQGVYCIIPYGTYDEMYIDSIEPGKVRKDVIYAQYNRDLETGMEEVIMDVKKGTEVNTGETPVQPSFPSPVTPLWEGGSFAYVKLYEVTVTYNAISVAEILDRSSVLLTPLQDVGQSVGDPANLTTTNKTNIVSAVNEVNGKAGTNASNISDLSSAMEIANGNITNLQGRMTAAEGDIDTLEGDIDTLEGDIDTLESAVFSERKVYTERFATNVTGNGRLMLMVSAWKKDTACVNVRFSNRVTGGFTDVVLMIKQNSYYTKCKQMYNDGIGISKIYRGANNTTFDFEIPTSTNNAYDVYVTAPVWVSGTYGAQTSLSGTEMTIDSFDYNEMELTVGNLSNLSTTTHSNIVAAINEVNGKIVDTDYAITEYSVPYVSGSNAVFMIRSNEVAVVGDEEYLLNVEVIDANGNAVEMLFLTTDDSVVNSKVVINQRSQTSNFEAIPISKIEDASSFISGNNAVLWVTLEGTPDVTVRLTHHKSKTYTVVASPAMPSGTGRAINFVNGNTELYSTKNGSVANYVSTKNGSVAIVSTADATYDIAIINEGGQNPDIRVFTLQGDVNINGNYVGKTSLSGIGDGTITGAIAFSNDDGEEVSGEVITVSDAIDANAVDVSVDIEPVQDLHGYDKPWVGGAGKNKLPMTVEGIKAANTSGTWSGNVYSYNGGTFEILVDSDNNVIGIKFNTTTNATHLFNLYSGDLSAFSNMIMSGAIDGNNSKFIRLNAGSTNYDDRGTGVNIGTVSGNGSIYIALYNQQSGTFQPMIRLSTETDPTFAPYSNICPINAVTESKNLFNGQLENGYYGSSGKVYSVDWKRSAEYIDVVGGQNYVLSGELETLGNYSSNGIFFYTKDGSSLAYELFNIDALTFSKSITAPQNCAKIGFYVRSNASIKYIQLEKSNQATPYEPYHEPQIEIQRVGKNLFDSQNVIQNAYISDTNGEVLQGNDSVSMDYTEVEAGQSYKFVSNKDAGNWGAVYDKNKNFILGITRNNYENLTIPQNGKYVRFTVSYNGNNTNYASNVMLIKTTESTTYEPYQGETYIIKTGENIYGAHHDATTGKMVVTHEYVDLGDLTWIASSTESIFYVVSLVNSINKKTMNAICSKYPCYKGSNQSGMEDKSVFVRSDGVVFIKDTSYTDVTTFKNSLSDAQLVYDLATPQTINLTQIQVKMLKGTDTLSSNAQTLNLTYLKDNAVGKAVSIVEKEIEPQIEEIHNELDTKLNSDSIAPVENGDTASTSYAVDSYIVRNNNLYKVISAISVGATFTSNNIQQTTVMAEILSRL